ncbi:ImmA/IrrE family metallo-endopeptidase [Paenibacillus ginsengihumi]|uniref:ImmA/IrrE family metallo-endopeptidase n=1 Tax=Paenibacillus ginsengihumi TaxID=431596 RepID=UPI003CCBD37F
MNLGCSGFVRVFDGQRAIFVNASESLGRQNYTIAHDYCHILHDLKKYAQLTGFHSQVNKYLKYPYLIKRREPIRCRPTRAAIAL